MIGIERLKRIEEIEKELETLPSGSIGKKNVGGREYYYLRWSEKGKIKERYIPLELLEDFKKKVERRKELKKELDSLSWESVIPDKEDHLFFSDVRKGIALMQFALSSPSLNKREIFSSLSNYLYDATYSKVFILYGLRRTGKTTMIKQAILEMPDEVFSKTAYIKVNPNNTIEEVNRDIRYLEKHGYKYIFIDEVTLLKDFIEGAALFSDIYAASKMKIVLSGSDSLSFLFAEDSSLYDRCITLHTTHIPYREFENVLDIKGIDEYIRFGGTMSSIFGGSEKTQSYVNTAIANNIQHSLLYYKDGRHFEPLRRLFEKRELTNVINRIVEDVNRRFALDVILREFESHDLAISNRNLLRDRNHPSDILTRIDKKGVTEELKRYLEIKEKEDLEVGIEESDVKLIEEYLRLLDLIDYIEVVNVDAGKRRSRVLISQPGLRYSQAEALVSSLFKDLLFFMLDAEEKKYVKERILNEIKGRMMEDIVLLETKRALVEKEVISLQFAIGEYDMVVYDPDKLEIEIYEIKHSKEAVKEQFRHLIDEEKIRKTERLYGKIVRKCVIYRGESKRLDNIEYINVEEYLKAL